MEKNEKIIDNSEFEKQAILDCTDDIVFLFNRNLEIIWANKNISKICSDPIGKKCHDIFCSETKRCDGCVVLSSFSSVDHVGLPKKSVIAGAKNSNLFFRISAMPVNNEGEETKQIIVIAQDITEKLQLMKQLRHSSKMEAVGTLAGGIAHDFNNVLTPIMGYSEIIKMNVQKSDFSKEEITEYLDEILRAAKRAKKLVEHILTYSRNIDYSESLQYIHPIIKEAMKLIHATIPSSINIVQDIDQNCGLVSVDPVEIHQILINLCTNAADAIGGKSGIVKIALKKNESSSDGRDWLELSVTDNGCGIDPEMEERIFDPYFTTKEKEQGTGMGLAMVHGIITRQGGKISVNSTVGEGTTVSLYLPVSQESTSLEKIISTDKLIGGNEHILLVDDEKQVVSATVEVLRNLGYKVTGMTSSRESLLSFYKEPEIFDLVLADFTMPYITGIELCEKIKEIRPDVPVLLFTGFLDEYSKAAAIQSGVDGFCYKPVSMKDMAESIRSALE